MLAVTSVIGWKMCFYFSNFLYSTGRAPQTSWGPG